MKCLYVKVLENEVIVTGMQADTTLIGRHASWAFGINLFQHTVGPKHFVSLLHFSHTKTSSLPPTPIDYNNLSETSFKHLRNNHQTYCTGNYLQCSHYHKVPHCVRSFGSPSFYSKILIQRDLIAYRQYWCKQPKY